MKWRNLQFSVLMLFFGLAVINAQNAIPVSGGIATGVGGSVNYTIGQVIYSTHTGSNGSVSEGVQQPYEISIITGIDEAIGIILISSIFPNPTVDLFTLKIENYDYLNLSYQLFDINGRLLEFSKITGSETIINLIRFSAGTYYLKIIDGAKDVKTFSIIKN